MAKQLGTSISPNPPSSPSWRAAKNAASRYATGGGEPGGRDPALPVSRFIAALGGGTAAAESSRVGQGVAGGLAGFAQTAATRGLPAALRELGLADAVGLSLEDALARIIDELAPGATTIDEMAAREALDEVLRDRVEEADDLDDAFAGLDAEGVLDLLRLFVVAYIFRRFLKALGQRFRDRSISAEATRQREDEVHRYIRDRVEYDFGDVGALQIDWKTEGARIIEELVTEAFDMLEDPGDR